MKGLHQIKKNRKKKKKIYIYIYIYIIYIHIGHFTDTAYLIYQTLVFSDLPTILSGYLKMVMIQHSSM